MAVFILIISCPVFWGPLCVSHCSEHFFTHEFEIRVGIWRLKKWQVWAKGNYVSVDKWAFLNLCEGTIVTSILQKKKLSHYITCLRSIIKYWFWDYNLGLSHCQE